MLCYVRDIIHSTVARILLFMGLKRERVEQNLSNWMATGLAWGSGDPCDHRHSILLHETCGKKKEPTNMGL